MYSFLSWPEDPEWSLLTLSLSLRERQSLPRGCPRPQVEVRGPDLERGGVQQAKGRLTDAQISGLTPGQWHPSHGALLPPPSRFQNPQARGRGTLTAWLALGVSLSAHAFLVSLGQKSSSG